MFQLQILWKQQGQWENTVYTPRDFVACKHLWEEYTKHFGLEHSYRIVEVKSTMDCDTPMADVYGG